MRHSPKIIEKIIKLRKNGFTITEIIFDTGLPKSTILHHIQDIPRSDYLKEKIRLARLKAQNRIAASRRGKSFKTYRFLKPEKWSIDLVNMLAHFIFDGSIKRTSCVYYNRSQVLVDMMIQKMVTILHVSDYKTYMTPEGVKRISYHHVEIAAFVRRKADELLEYISTAPMKYKISFLKAFFDDEGSITYKKNKRVVRGYQHTLKILQIVEGLLKDIDIESKVDEKYFEICIYKKDNLLKFQKLINFTPGIYVNGKRTNSIWKKDLEKRKILGMALESYL